MRRLNTSGCVLAKTTTLYGIQRGKHPQTTAGKGERARVCYFEIYGDVGSAFKAFEQVPYATRDN